MAKKPGMDVAIIARPHKPGADLSAPGPLDGGPPAAGGEDDGDEPDEDDQATGGIGPEDVDYSDNDLCGSCAHNQDGQCAKYGFPVDDTGHCEAGYEPQQHGQQPAGAQGAAPVAPPMGQ